MPDAPSLGPYDTRLSNQDEAAFQAWRAKLPPNLQDDSNYDLRGAFKANAQEAGNGHLPDTFKKPNHPTFSNESRYSNTNTPGGEWVQTGPPTPQMPEGTWAFKASAFVAKQHPELPDYFKRVEPGNQLIMPLGMGAAAK